MCSGKSETLQSFRFRSCSHPNVLGNLLVPGSNMIETWPMSQVSRLGRERKKSRPLVLWLMAQE